MDREQLAHMIDHTLLRPEATDAEAKALVAHGVELGVYSVCVSPSRLPIDAHGLHVAAVCGFPSGAHDSSVKVAESVLAVTNGADEIDMVVDLGLAKAGDWESVFSEVVDVRQAVPLPVVLKIIIESAVLTDEEIVLACQAVKEAGADFVETSTGSHPAGGATTHAVRLMKDTVGDDLQIKASGGIRSLEMALAMIEAGATRLGLSGGATILSEFAGAGER